MKAVINTFTITSVFDDFFDIGQFIAECVPLFPRRKSSNPPPDHLKPVQTPIDRAITGGDIKSKTLNGIFGGASVPYCKEISYNNSI